MKTTLCKLLSFAGRSCKKMIAKPRVITVGSETFLSGTSREELAALIRSNHAKVTGYALLHRL